jgi:hypothetical protein
VDSEAVVASVGKQIQNLRSGEVWRSPMTGRNGCKGCHVPLDYKAAFFPAFRTSWWGSFRSDAPMPTAHLFITGVEDDRGSGVGMRALNEMIARQPEFPRCVVNRFFEYYVKRPPLSADQPVVEQLVADFDRHGRKIPWLIRSILTSAPYQVADQ